MSLFILYFYLFGALSEYFRLSTTIGDHMALQRSPERAAIWGYSTVSDVITINFQEKNYSTKTIDCRWKILLPPTPGSYVSYNLKVYSSMNSTVFSINDVVFGDIWFCSGQSNMEMGVLQAENGSYWLNDSVNYPFIRVRTVKETWSVDPIDDLDVEFYHQPWMVNGPKALGGSQWTYFSALCYYYGLTLHKKLNVPIGLFSSPYEGTLIEPWTPPIALKQCSHVQEHKPPQPANEHPSSLYNKQIHPFLNMTIKGMIWLQGEANVAYNPGNRLEHDGYACIFPLMVKYLRQYWSETPNTTNPNFPFGFATLAGYSGVNISYQQESNLPHLRFSQQAQYPSVPNPDQPNTFSVDSIDLEDSLQPGNPFGSIHPRNKYELGERMGIRALDFVYGIQDLLVAIPIYAGCQIKSNSVLTVQLNKSQLRQEVVAIKNTFGFDVYNNDTKKWVQVPILLSSTKYSIDVNISSVSANTITQIRYNWYENPCCPSVYTITGPYLCVMRECAVYSSKSDLPLSTFKSNIIQSICTLEYDY